jgi:putative membrane protein
MAILRVPLRGTIMEKTDSKEPIPRSRWGQLKACFLNRYLKGSEVHRDLSDKNTFFAWQRNHMANERTFLAWCRTGISLIVFSFVIERFDLLIRELRFISPSPQRFVHMEKTQYASIITFVLGAFIILLAGWRFFDVRRHINRGESEFSTLPDIFLLTSILLTLAMIFFLFVFLY